MPAKKIKGIKKWWEEQGKEVFCRWRVINIDIKGEQFRAGRKINRPQKEIDELKEQQAERLKRMYALGLAPFRGYYDKILKSGK